MRHTRHKKEPGQGFQPPPRQIEDTVMTHGTRSNNTPKAPASATSSLYLVIKRTELVRSKGTSARARSARGDVPPLDWTVIHTYHPWDE